MGQTGSQFPLPPKPWLSVFRAIMLLAWCYMRDDLKNSLKLYHYYLLLLFFLNYS